MQKKSRIALKTLMLRCMAVPFALVAGVASADSSGAPWIPPYSGLSGLAQGTAWFVPLAPSDIPGALGTLPSGEYQAVFQATPDLAPYSGIPNTPLAASAPVAASFNVTTIGFTTAGPPPAGGYPFYGQGANLTGDVTNCNPGGPGCSLTQNISLGGFLNSLGAVAGPVAYQSGYSAASPLVTNPGPGATLGLFIQIIGTMILEHGQLITIAHDDGVDLILGTQGSSCAGVVTACQDFTGFLNHNNAPGALERAYWNGPTGAVPFDLVYVAGRSYPGYLEVHVPEPGTLGLLGLGGMLLGLARRRRLP